MWILVSLLSPTFILAFQSMPVSTLVSTLSASIHSTGHKDHSTSGMKILSTNLVYIMASERGAWLKSHFSYFCYGISKTVFNRFFSPAKNSQIDNGMWVIYIGRSLYIMV